jgi:cyclophilin family peptidyl-prolyl cis-trans isomerase
MQPLGIVSSLKEVKDMRKFSILLLSLVGLLVGGCSSTIETPTPTQTLSPTPTIKLYAAPPPMIIDTSKHYTAIIETVKGNITLELFAKDVPVTVNNFVFLAREGFYDNCTFHRVIPGFVAQGGDPTGTGAGNPGYFIPDEITQHTHVAGALSMANAGLHTNTNGCQFFITYTAQHGLDGGYSVFGQLIQGIDVLESLTPRDPTKYPTYKGDTIIRIVIEES